MLRPHKLALAAIACHSLVLGGGMLIAPYRVLGLVRWDYGGPDFFPSQAGVFLMLLGGAYMSGIRYRPFAWFAVISKAVAVAFLLSRFALGPVPPAILAAAVLDGLMGIGLAILLVRCPEPALRGPPEHDRHRSPETVMAAEAPSHD